jgi:hypothetical protein
MCSRATLTVMKSPRSALVVGIGIGLLVAGAALAILLATGAIGGGGDDGVDTRDVVLPDDLDGTRTRADVLGESGHPDQAESAERVNEATADALRDAYGGAATDVETYSSDELDTSASIAVIRARSPELVPPLVVSAGDLGLAVPIDDVETIGDVECLIRNPPTPEGQEVDVEQIVVQLCQRTGEDLTVRAVGIVGDLSADDVAALVDAAWLDVAG